MTTEFAATIESSPIVTPFMTALLKPSQHRRPIETGRVATSYVPVCGTPRIALKCASRSRRVGRMAVVVEDMDAVREQRHVADRDFGLRADDHVVADIDGVADRNAPAGLAADGAADRAVVADSDHAFAVLADDARLQPEPQPLAEARVRLEGLEDPPQEVARPRARSKLARAASVIPAA